MDMLCIAASHDPIGYVSVAGHGLSETDIARMTGGSESVACALLGELERNGVFSRDRKGTIYSRRMVSDAKKAAIAKKNGKNGGNPTLSKETVISSSDKGPDKPPLKPHIPVSITQEEEPVSVETKVSTGTPGADLNSDFPAWWPTVDRYGRVTSEVTDKILYAVGKAIMGDNCGGQITKLKATKKYSYVQMVELLFDAEKKAEPKKYWAAVVRRAQLDDFEITPSEKYPRHSY